MADRETGAADAPRAGDDARPPGAPGTPAGRRRWPVSATCCVVVSSSLAVVLLLLNLFGIQVGHGEYDADIGGSVAEWFGAVATLVTIPVAVFVGVRQLQSSGEALDLGRRQLAIDEIERAGRRGVEQALLRDAVRLKVTVDNVVDSPDLATDAELAAVDRWRDECRQRGWTPDPSGSAWDQGALRRTNAEQLASERSPLLRKPWFLALECRNAAAMTVLLLRWTVRVGEGSTTFDTRVELRDGERHRLRLGTDAGVAPALAKAADAEALARAVSVTVDACDAADRPFRIAYPRWE
jgi:hypothetical protein